MSSPFSGLNVSAGLTCSGSFSKQTEWMMERGARGRLCLHCMRCRPGKQEVSLAGRRGWPRGIYPVSDAAVLFRDWIYRADFSAAEANERIAAQMDQPSPRDSIAITINAAAVPNRGPIPCAHRWRSFNIQSAR